MDKVVKGPGGTGGFELPQTFEEINSTMKTLIETASVDRVYGAPIEVGETKIIPAAENLVFMGFGVGGGYGSAPIKDELHGHDTAPIKSKTNRTETLLNNNSPLT